MIIAVDFDGTIVKHQFPEIGKVLPNAFETLKKWQLQGHKIILWTCRNHKELYEGRDLLHEAIVFCEKQGFEFDAINCNSGDIAINPQPKIYADLYIDDRANFSSIDWNRLNVLLAERLNPKLSTEIVVEFIQIHTGVPDLKVKRRFRQLVDARNVAMFALKLCTCKSLATIGYELGGFDHVTVMRACKEVDKMRNTDKKFMKLYTPVFEHFNI